jgi:hypothetical protein
LDSTKLLKKTAKYTTKQACQTRWMAGSKDSQILQTIGLYI